MDNYKEIILEHCDKVAFAVVAVITLAVLVITGTGKDVVGSSQQQIRNYQEKIARIENKQVMIPEPQIPKTEKEIKANWWQTSLPTRTGRAFLMYRQPAVVRLFAEKLKQNLQHTKPQIIELSMERDRSLKKVIIRLRAKMGKLANVKPVSVAVLRRALPLGSDKGEPDFREIGEVDVSSGIKSEEEIFFVDINCSPGRRYAYVVRSTVQPLDPTKTWAEGSRAVQASDPFPPEGKCDQFIVPYDLRIRFSQGQLASTTNEAGVGYFDVEYYDYEKGEIERQRLIKIEEWLQRGRPPETHILPHTRYYLLILRKTEKGLVAVLKNADQPADRLSLLKDQWVPPVIELPKPCSLIAQPEETSKKEVAKTEKKKARKPEKSKVTSRTKHKKTGKTTKSREKTKKGPAREVPTGPFK